MKGTKSEVVILFHLNRLNNKLKKCSLP